jgi:hypothetical protein
MAKEGKIELREGHLEILSRIGTCRKWIHAVDIFNYNLSHEYVTDLFRWGLIKVKGDGLETLGPYILTNLGRTYLDDILTYSSNELSKVV